MSVNMRLSVIVVNWNVKDLLHECLKSLYQETALPRDKFEIFVVDNDSSDGSVEMVREQFPDVHLVANKENVGFGRANNQVLDRCKGEYILLFNPDAMLIDNSIDRLLIHADEHQDVAIWGARLLNIDRSLQRWTGGAFPNIKNITGHYLFITRLLSYFGKTQSLYLETDVDVDVDVDWVSGACMLLRSDALDNKLFNDKFFMYGEDMELCHRIKENGWRVVYTPMASIVHVQGASMKSQEGDILLSSLKGLRSFYTLLHGDRKIWMVDLITMAGFGIRWMLYSVLGLTTRKQHFKLKAKSSLDYIKITQKIIKQENKTNNS
jgi:GT2 family glycosyltransferase